MLITGSQGPAWADAAAKATQKFGIEIAVASIGTDYRDTDGQWAQVREISDGGAILVRPDNYVAWRSLSSTADPADTLVTAVGTILHR